MIGPDSFDPARDPVSVLLESSTEGFCALDQDHRCIYANRAAERILGMPREQLIGHPIVSRLPAPVAERAREQIRSALSQNATAEFRVPWNANTAHRGAAAAPASPAVGMTAAEGPTQWFDVRICPSELGLTVYFHDVTRQVQAEQAHQAAEQALRDSEQRLRQALAVGNCGIYEWDVVADRVTWSERLYELFALPPGSDVGGVAEFAARIHPEDREPVQNSVRACLERDVPHRMEYRIIRGDGQVRWLLTSSGAVRDVQGRPLRLLGACIDITDRKGVEQEAIRARREAEHANRTKDQFLAVLSHELRTPLTPVVMTVAAMELDRALPPQLREDLAMIRRNIELETKLIDDLLDVTRIANGKLRLQPRPSDVHALARHVVDILQAGIAAKQLNVSIDLAAGDASVSADPARLQQVFWNLLKNAVKFTRGGGRVAIRTWNPSPRSVCLEVVDDGAGIDAAVLPGIFNAFEQGDPTVSRQFGGLGLGLAISRALTEMHGGTLRAQSDGKGRGARFTVELPTRTPVERLVDKLQPVGVAQQGAGKPVKIRILLVEDHVDTQRTLRRLLEHRGFAVCSASSVAAARGLLADRPFDILVSDIGLPDESGLELMRHVRRTHGIPGVAISGFGTDADLRGSQEAGFAAHMTKPLDLAQLDAMIRVLTGPDSTGSRLGAALSGPSQGL